MLPGQVAQPVRGGVVDGGGIDLTHKIRRQRTEVGCRSVEDAVNVLVGEE